MLPAPLRYALARVVSWFVPGYARWSGAALRWHAEKLRRSSKSGLVIGAHFPPNYQRLASVAASTVALVVEVNGRRYGDLGWDDRSGVVEVPAVPAGPHQVTLRGQEGLVLQLVLESDGQSLLLVRYWPAMTGLVLPRSRSHRLRVYRVEPDGAITKIDSRVF